MDATTIATINFKGGVGKTTVTWCLANVSAATMHYLSATYPMPSHEPAYLAERKKYFRIAVQNFSYPRLSRF